MDLEPQQVDDSDPLRHEVRHDFDGLASASPIIRIPLLLVDLFASGLRLLRPWAPQLIPLAVFALLIPIVAFFSLSAGWFVWRSIAVGWETDIHLLYGDGPSPYAWITLSNLAAHQPYDISVQLHVPPSESNFALGNFMTTLTLVTASNKTIASVRRPAIVTPLTPSLISFLYRTTGQVYLEIPLLSSFETGASNVLAHVELGRADQWRSVGSGEGRELSVSFASLRGVVVHKGLRGIMTRFPLLTAMISSGAFLFVSLFILASCILPVIEWRLYPGAAASDTEIHTKSRRHPSDRSDWSAQRPKGPKRSRSATTLRHLLRDDVKGEENISTMPSPINSTPLRRRRSRLSQPDSEA